MMTAYEYRCVDEYLGEGHPMLSRQQEVELFKRIEVGRRAAIRLAKNSKHHKKKLEKKIRRGEEARTLVITCNQRLVISVAKEYVGRCGYLTIMDLINEGNLGLLDAIESFDWRRGCKLNTHAFRPIRKCIQEAAAHARPLNLSPRLNKEITVYKRTARELAEDLGCQPSQKEIAFAMSVLPAQVHRIKCAAATVRSLHVMVTGSGDEDVFWDLMVDTRQKRSNEIVEMNALKEVVGEVLDQLDPVEKEVIDLRFGLANDGEGKTLQQIGDQKRLSRERIRQIEADALRRLRYNKKIQAYA